MKNMPVVWVPSLYFAEGVPYILVNIVSINILKSLGISNDLNALLSSLLMWPWVIKPLWSPIVDVIGSKKTWVIAMQLLMGAAALICGLFIGAGNGALYLLIGLFSAIAFLSATHDIAADGFYIIHLTPPQQSMFSGIRSSFYRCAMIATQGGLVILAGVVAESSESEITGWRVALLTVGVFYLFLSVFHTILLPNREKMVADTETKGQGASVATILKEFGESFVSFFRKKNVIHLLLFILFYRFAESQLGKMTAPFILDPVSDGGLALSLKQQGTIYGTIGVVSLLVGGIAGGFWIVKTGLRKAIWPMALFLNVPNLVYVYLSYAQPESLSIITGCVALEQLGYGLGFSSFMMMLLLFAADSGKYQTSHYAIMTGFMAAGMMIPGTFAGVIETAVGYQHFFLWVCICTLASFGAVWQIYHCVPPEFGRKTK